MCITLEKLSSITLTIVCALQRGTPACWFPRNGFGDFSIMLPGRHFLASTQMREVTLLKPCYVDFVIPLSHHCGSFAHPPVRRSLAGLLVTLSRPHRSQLKALLTRSAILLAKTPLSCLSEVGPISPRQTLQRESHGCRTQSPVANTSSTTNCWCAVPAPSSSHPFPHWKDEGDHDPGPRVPDNHGCVASMYAKLIFCAIQYILTCKSYTSMISALLRANTLTIQELNSVFKTRYR